MSLPRLPHPKTPSPPAYYQLKSPKVALFTTFLDLTQGDVQVNATQMSNTL